MLNVQVVDWKAKCRESLENDLHRCEAALNDDFYDSVQRSIEMQIAYRINSALERFEQGCWGICEKCQSPIGQDRLMALPYAELCMPCQTEWDKRLSWTCHGAIVRCAS